MAQVTITHPDSSTDTIPVTNGYEVKRELGHMRRLEIDVERSLLDGITLQRKQDLVELPDTAQHRLVNVETGGPVHTLKCYSLEWDANKEGFLSGGTLRQNTDDTLISNLVGEVSNWSPGTINSFTGTLSFVFNHAGRHEAIRRIEKNTPGEVQFRDAGTVDYLQRLGTDRSGSVELSASAGTIEDEIVITERGRKLDGTHVRVLGAHEGEAQLFANLIPSGDTTAQNNNDNVVTYSTSRWTEEADTDWDRWVNKDVTDQDTLDEEAAALGEELKESNVEAKATVSGVDLNIGDTVQVVKPDANLDRAMRVHRLARRVGSRSDTDSGAAEVQDVLLSTRNVFREDEGMDLRDIQRFNSGFQGNSIVLQGGGSRQPLDDGLPAKVPFRYPPVDFEHVVEVQIQTLPYRAYSSGGDQQDLSVTNITMTPDLSSDTTLNPGDDVDIIETVPSDYNNNWGNFVGGIETDLSGETLINANVRSAATGTVWDFTAYTDSIGSFDFSLPITEISSGDDLIFGIGNPVDNSNSFTVEAAGTGYNFYNPDHTHPPSPGIVEQFATFGGAEFTPTNVDLLVNGSTVATDIGSGEFQTVVDISGELIEDAWNTIEAQSDDLGHIVMTVYAEVYKQIGTV